MRSRVPLTLVLCALLTLGACDLTSAAERRGVVGIIGGGSDFPETLEAPDTVLAGIPFEVRVTTIGPTTCWQAEGADVEVAGLSIEIVPYDRTTRVPGGACPTALVFLPRVLTLSLSKAGEALIRVNGRAFGGAEASVEANLHVR